MAAWSPRGCDVSAGGARALPASWTASVVSSHGQRSYPDGAHGAALSQPGAPRRGSGRPPPS